MNNYKWNAEDYESHSKAQQRWALELLEKLKLSAHEQVLDLGCGDGKVTVELARRLTHGGVVGVDSSSQMIQLAQQRYPASEYPNLSFELADARELTMENQFDVVFSNAALHWVQNHEPVVQGLYRCLKPGGRTLLQMGGEGNAAGILSTLDQLCQDKKWRSYFENFEFPYGFLGVAEYQRLLKAAGFLEKRVQLIPKAMMHDGIAGLEGWIRTTWMPYTTRVPENLRDQLVSEIANNYVQQYPLTATGEVQVDMVRIEVEAEKPINS